MANNWNVTLPSPYAVFLQQGLYGAATLPGMTVSGLIHTNASLSTPVGGAILPGLTSSGSFGGLTAALTLPAVIGGGTGTIPNLLRAALTLPAVTLSASGTMGRTIVGAGVLPNMTATMARGWIFAKDLPALTGGGTISHSLNMVMGLTLPRVTGSGTITNAMSVLTGHLVLPAVVGMSGSGAGAMSLPALKGSGTVVSGTQAVRVAWAMNLTHGLVTEFTSFPFRQFARAYDRYYGAHLDAGLYTMGGDKDVAAPISWEFQTGLSDVNSRGLKGVLALYLDGVAEKGCDFGVVTDRGTYWYGHSPHGTPNNHQTQRVPIGKALRSVNWAFAMRSTKGAYVEVDSISPEWQLSNRNL